MKATICVGVLIALGAAATSPRTSRRDQKLLFIIMAVVVFLTFMSR